MLLLHLLVNGSWDHALTNTGGVFERSHNFALQSHKIRTGNVHEGGLTMSCIVGKYNATVVPH